MPEASTAAENGRSVGPTVPQYRQLLYAVGATLVAFFGWRREFQSVDGGWIIAAALALFAVAVVGDLLVQWWVLDR